MNFSIEKIMNQETRKVSGIKSEDTVNGTFGNSLKLDALFVPQL